MARKMSSHRETAMYKAIMFPFCSLVKLPHSPFSPAALGAIQVNEMNCKMKGQISLALAKVKRLGVPIDLDDKEDYSAVLFQATQIMAAMRKEGSTSWCKARSANMDAFLRSD
jgi:hypothetical protein